MIAASGMLMLSRFERRVSNTTGANYWANAAVRVSTELEFDRLRFTRSYVILVAEHYS